MFNYSEGKLPNRPKLVFKDVTFHTTAAADQIRDIVRERDEALQLRARDADRWAAKVVEREKEVEGLQAELAARPVVESEAARRLRDVAGITANRCVNCVHHRRVRLNGRGLGRKRQDSSSTVAGCLSSGNRSVYSSIHQSLKVCSGWNGMWGEDAELTYALRAFLESAPPTAAPLNRDLESLEHVTHLYGRSLDEWRKLLRWIEFRVDPLPDEQLTVFEMVERAAMAYAAPRVERDVDRELREALVRWLKGYAQDIEADMPIDPVAAALQPVASRWLAAPLSPAVDAQPDNYTRLAVAYAEADVDETAPAREWTVASNAFRNAYSARQRGEPVSRLTPLEQAAVELAEAYAVWHVSPQVQGTWAAFDAARDRYLALRDGGEAKDMDHRTDALVYAQFDPAKHVAPPQETVDVWLAQYDSGAIFLVPNGLAAFGECHTAKRFLRVRLPVVEAVENEKGGA